MIKSAPCLQLASLGSVKHLSLKPHNKSVNINDLRLNSRNFWHSDNGEVRLDLEMDWCFLVSIITLLCIFKLNLLDFFKYKDLLGGKENIMS